MASRLLVTGANGFVGRHLLHLLLSGEIGDDIHAWHRPTTAPPEAEAFGTKAGVVRWHAVEMLDRAAVRQALLAAPPDQVYHLAGSPHVGQSWSHSAEVLDGNVIASHLLLDELRRLSIDARVLVSGSATIYAGGDTALTEESPLAPASPYALSKLAQEMLAVRAARHEGQAVVVVRAFNHVGPGQDPSFFAPAFARQLAEVELGVRDPVLRVGNLEPRRDLTDVRDTVRAYRDLMRQGQPGRPYNVCSGEARRIRDILDALISRSSVDVRVETDAALLRPSDTPVVLGSFDRIRSEIGWAPAIPFDRTLSDILDDARNRVSLRTQEAPPLARRP